MNVTEVTLTKFQLKQLFEEFNSQVNDNGISAKYSWFIYKNCESMAQEYANLMNSLYDERKESEYPNVLAAQQALYEKYGDRDENNKLKINPENGRPFISDEEKIKSYEIDFMKLKGEYKKFFEKFDKKNSINQAIYNERVTIMATKMDLSEFPPNTKPFIVGILGY